MSENTGWLFVILFFCLFVQCNKVDNLENRVKELQEQIQHIGEHDTPPKVAN